MVKYRAIVSIEMTQDEIAKYCADLGVSPKSVDIFSLLNGELDNLAIGNGQIEDVFMDGFSVMKKWGESIQIDVSPHNLEA